MSIVWLKIGRPRSRASTLLEDSRDYQPFKTAVSVVMMMWFAVYQGFVAYPIRLKVELSLLALARSTFLAEGQCTSIDR